MSTCQTYQSQLLHHLYGLLDDAEHQALVKHLGSCPACQVALEKARHHQHLLAAAAKAEFPDVRFQAVGLSTGLRTQPTLGIGALKKVESPSPQVKRRSLVSRRWAIAASIFLVVGGPLLYVAGIWASYSYTASQARQELARLQKQSSTLAEKQNKEQADLQADIAAIYKQIEAVESQYRDQLIQIKRTYDSKPVQLSVTHPKTLQAGGINQISIDATRKPGVAKGPDYQLIAMVVDEKSKTEFARLVLRDGHNDFLLPADLPIKPGTQLSLRVLGAEPGKADEAIIDESLPLVTSLFVTHLTTDRPMYRPGEVVYFRSLTLERFSFKPADEHFELHFRFVKSMGGQEQNIAVIDPETGQPAKLTGGMRLKNKDGSPLLGPDGKELHGIGAGSFRLPAELPGGEYTVIVSEAYDRFPAERRKIIVNRYQAPRLYKDVDFTRKSYGAGDVVTATCKVSPVEGGRVLAKVPVKASATVDGLPCEVITKSPLLTDEHGHCIVQFQLPKTIERGDGVLSVTFDDGGNVETTVEPIPIVLKKLKVEFFPEGGELVAGASNRVYFQVRTPLNKPAELRGRIVDQDGKEAAAIQTFNDDKEIGVNQGMGRFEFTPAGGKRYELKIDAPEGIDGQFWLSPVQTSGVALHVGNGVVTEQINVELFSAGKARKLLVGAYCRGQLLDNQTVTVAAGKMETVTLKPFAAVAGVYRVTVFEMADGDSSALKPVAERLVYRRSPEKLNLKAFADKKIYTPGDRVTISLSATDQHNKPAPAIVLVSVVDKSILKLRNDRTARAMPTHFLLTSEVRGPEDLEYADFLLLEESKDGSGQDVVKAETALDLLLGTQGWRRFVEQRTPAEQTKMPPNYKDDTNRLLTVNGQASLVQESLVAHSASKAANEIAVKHEKLQRDLAKKEVAQDTGVAAAKAVQARLNQAIANQQSALSKAQRGLEGFAETLRKIGPSAILGGFLVLAVILWIVGRIGLRSGRPIGSAFLVGSMMCVIILACYVVWFAPQTGLEDLVFKTQMAPRAGHAPLPINDAEVEVLRARVVLGADVGLKKDDKGGVPLQPGIAIQPAANQNLPPGLAPLFGGIGEKGDEKNFNQKIPTALPDPIAFGTPPKAQAKGFPGMPADDLTGGGKIKDADGNIAVLDLARRAKVGQLPSFGVEMETGGLTLAQLRQLRQSGLFNFVTNYRLTTLQWESGAAWPQPALALVTADAFAIREYAHQHASSPDNVRRDFAETVYWHPALVLPGEKALDIRFDLSDAVTQFEVKVWGHTLDGRLGAMTTDLASRLPFSLDAKLPIEISSTDKLSIPIALANDTEKNRDVKLSVEAANLKFQGKAEHLVPLPANSRTRKVLQFQPSIVQGDATLRLFGLCEPFGMDSVERTFKIVPEGFPVADKQSGMLEVAAVHHIKLPAKRTDWVPGTMKLQAQVFPSTLADLQKGLESLLREPGGCFEQTSSSNYPNVMILDYLKESGQVRPDIEKNAVAMLQRGYSRLITFECVNPKAANQREGYEWFGQTAPPHGALTAYGLMQFLDMAKHIEVDKSMVERTQRYLLNLRDGKGGFVRDSRAIDSFGRAPDNVTNAYITWALCEAGVRDDLKAELDAVVANAGRSEDPYLLSLASLGLLKRGQIAQAMPLLKKLKAKQMTDGSLAGAQTSITQSGGAQLAIETTSLALLAWLRANQPQEFGDNVRKAGGWIGKQRGGYGGYGSTQSTILALKALIAFTRENKKTAEAGEVRLIVNGKPAATKAFPANAGDAITVELVDDNALNADQNSVRLEITGKNVFPYTLSWSYMALTPANQEICPVRLTTKLSALKAPEGDAVLVTAELQNTSGKEQGMAVAIVGLPGGCSLPPDMQELKNLVKAGKIDSFEIRGREVVLYWRGLAADAKHTVSFSVVCQVPGLFRGPASRAYLYYNTDERWWVEPLGVEIVAKGQ